tara:strand:- start:326 stop:427 length:102 start_codon:yes stop_codon:yes gene_type:complete
MAGKMKTNISTIFLYPKILWARKAFSAIGYYIR